LALDAAPNLFDRRRRAGACAPAAQAKPASAASARSKIDATIRSAIKSQGLNAVIVQATVDGRR
jgi:hypothetical protein